jgi:hypothetical protein
MSPTAGRALVVSFPLSTTSLGLAADVGVTGRKLILLDKTATAGRQARRTGVVPTRRTHDHHDDLDQHVEPVSTTTSTSVTTSTFLPCAAPDPICWGTCPAATPICASGPSGCECVPGATPCGSASFPECDGACPEDRACVASSNLQCTCDAVSTLPCEFSGFPLCGGDCAAGVVCRSVSTPDGSGCVCQPIGSTCLDGSPVCNGTCPGGQTCFSIAGICLCG